MSQTEVQLIKDAVIVNADISNSAAIDVSKISGAMPLAGGTFTGDILFQSDSGNILFDKSDNALEFSDNNKAKFGGSADLEIFHSGTHSIIKDTGTGNLQIAGSLIQLTNAAISASMLVANEGGSVELNHNGSKKFETTAYGAKTSGELEIDSGHLRGDSSNGLRLFSDSTATTGITLSTEDDLVPQTNNAQDLGSSSLRYRDIFVANDIDISDNGKVKLGDGDDLQIVHTGSDSQITDTGTGSLALGGSAVFIQNASHNANMASFVAGAEANLFYNDSKKFETTSDGGKITGELDVHKSGTGDVFHVQGNGTGAVVAKVENAYNSDNDRFAILELKSGKGSIRFNSNGDSNEGAITYNMADNTMVFGVNNASEKLRIQSGGGISFNGDTAAANALDDYEEGTFTPAFNTTADNLTFNGGSRTNSSLYQARSGSYTKVGRRVWFQISMSTTGLTSVGGSDFIALDGLPFTAASESSTYPRFVMACQAGRFDTTNTFVPLFLVLNPGTTTCQLRQSFDVQKTISSFNVTGSGNRNVIEAFGSYEVAS